MLALFFICVIYYFSSIVFTKLRTFFWINKIYSNIFLLNSTFISNGKFKWSSISHIKCLPNLSKKLDNSSFSFSEKFLTERWKNKINREWMKVKRRATATGSKRRIHRLYWLLSFNQHKLMLEPAVWEPSEKVKADHP